MLKHVVGLTALLGLLSHPAHTAGGHSTESTAALFLSVVWLYSLLVLHFPLLLQRSAAPVSPPHFAFISVCLYA